MLVGGFSDVSISRSGVRLDCEGAPYWGASFKLDADVRILFPYINGTVKNARYGIRPLHVQFDREGVRCTLYPTEAIAAPFTGRDHVFAFIEELVLFLNDMYDRRHRLTPNHTIHRPPASMVDLIKALPRTNCRECGHPTCMSFAAALRSGDATAEDCPGFVKPLSRSTVYPVFDPEGTVVSTFTIEKEFASPEPARDLPQTDPVAEPGTAAPRVTMRDGFGIRIQEDLTPREIEVLRLVAKGASNPEISEVLGISPHTVKSHVIHIFNKLNVNDRTQAAVWAAQNQIL